MSLEYHTLQQHSHYAQLVSHIRRGQFSAVLAHLDSPQHAPLVWSVLRQRDRHNRTLLHHAAEAAAGAAPASSTSEALALVQALLDAPAASSELLDAQDTEGSTALHFAVITGNASLVRLLLQRMTTAQVNIADYELHTPMHWAVVCGRLLCVQLLLEAGAQLDTPDIYGAHPLHYATQSVSAPLTAAGDMFVFPSGRPGRHAAHQPQPPPPPPTTSNTTQQRRPGDQLRLLHYLLAIRLHVDVNCTDNEARTPLIWAASSGNHEALHALVKAGAEVTQQDKEGLSALHCAASRGHYKCLDILVMICGADVHQTDASGCTPLFYATALGHADCVRLLIEAGAHLDHQDNKGRTAAHCGASKGQLETLRILHQHGANFGLKNMRGDLPLHEAIKSGRKDLVRWLLDLNRKSVNEVNLYGRAALHIASFNNNLDLVRMLVEDYGADVNSVMKVRTHYLTPLDAANQNAADDVAEYLPSVGGKPIAQINQRVDEYLRHHQHQKNVETTTTTAAAADLDHFVGFDSSLEESEEYRQLRERYSRTKRSVPAPTGNETKLPNLVKNGHETKHSNNGRTLSSTSSAKSAATHSAHGGHVHNVREVDQQLAPCGHHHLRQAIITNVYLTTPTPPPLALMSPGGTHRRTAAPLKKGGKKMRKTAGMTVANGTRTKENGKTMKNGHKDGGEMEEDGEYEEEIEETRDNSSEGVKVTINAKDTFVSRHETREDRLEMVEQLLGTTGADGTRVVVESMTRTRMESDDGSMEENEEDIEDEFEENRHDKFEERYEKHEEVVEKTKVVQEEEEENKVKRGKRSIDEEEHRSETEDTDVKKEDDEEDIDKMTEEGQQLSMIDEDVEGETSKMTEGDKTVPSAKTSREHTIDEEGSEMDTHKDGDDEDVENRKDEDATESKTHAEDDVDDEIKKRAERDVNEDSMHDTKGSRSQFSRSESSATTAREDEDDDGRSEHKIDDEMNRDEDGTSIKTVEDEDMHSVGVPSTRDGFDDQESVLSKEVEEEKVIDDKQEDDQHRDETEEAQQDEKKAKSLDDKQESMDKEGGRPQDEQTIDKLTDEDAESKQSDKETSMEGKQESIEKTEDADKQSDKKTSVDDQHKSAKTSMEDKQESIDKTEDADKQSDKTTSVDDQHKSAKTSMEKVNKDQSDEDLVKSADDDDLPQRKSSTDKPKSMEKENIDADEHEDEEIDNLKEEEEVKDKPPENEVKVDNYFDKVVDEAKEGAIEEISERFNDDKASHRSEDIAEDTEDQHETDKEGAQTSDQEIGDTREKIIKKRSVGSLQSEMGGSQEGTSLVREISKEEDATIIDKLTKETSKEEATIIDKPMADVSRALRRQDSPVVLSDAEETRQQRTHSLAKVSSTDNNDIDAVVDKLKTPMETLKVKMGKDKEPRTKEDKDIETDREDFKDNATFLKEGTDEDEEDEEGGHGAQQYTHKRRAHPPEGPGYGRRVNKQYAHIRPKVDTFWGPNHGREGAEGLNRHHSRSIHLGPLTAQEQYDQIDPAVIQQTVEKYVRKYYLERKLFEELYDLKRYQIRTGRSNEPQMVKRLAEKFRRDVRAPGMNDFKGPYTYKAYEMFLYDQLRHLSRSNDKKISHLTKSMSLEDVHNSGSGSSYEEYERWESSGADEAGRTGFEFEKRQAGPSIDYKYEYHKSQHFDRHSNDLIDVTLENLYKRTGLHGHKVDEMEITRKSIERKAPKKKDKPANPVGGDGTSAKSDEDKAKNNQAPQAKNDNNNNNSKQDDDGGVDGTEVGQD